MDIRIRILDTNPDSNPGLGLTTKNKRNLVENSKTSKYFLQGLPKGTVA
jgi:hypothetical protein